MTLIGIQLEAKHWRCVLKNNRKKTTKEEKINVLFVELFKNWAKKKNKLQQTSIKLTIFCFWVFDIWVRNITVRWPSPNISLSETEPFCCHFYIQPARRISHSLWLLLSLIRILWSQEANKKLGKPAPPMFTWDSSLGRISCLLFCSALNLSAIFRVD